MPSICCLRDLDTFPGFFFSTKVLGHKQIVGYQIPPFWLILETSICNHFNFPTRRRNLLKKFYFSLEIERRSREEIVGNSGRAAATGETGRRVESKLKKRKKKRVGREIPPLPLCAWKERRDRR